MWTIIGAIVALGILVLVHETGHYLAARWFGVEIEKFSIGFGKKLVSFRKWNTEFMISLIPLGGYVKMKGENPDEEITDTAHAFRSKTWWQRAVIAFAGPFMNLIFALLLFITSFAIGRHFEDQNPVVGSVTDEYSSYFQPQDVIIKINEKAIQGWNQIIQNSNENQENIIELQRNGETKTLQLPPLQPAFWYEGVKPYIPAMVGEVSPGLPAYKAGLMEGDEILAVNGEPVKDWYEMRELITNNSGNSVQLTIRREDH